MGVTLIAVEKIVFDKITRMKHNNLLFSLLSHSALQNTINNQIKYRNEAAEGNVIYCIHDVGL